MSKHDNILEKQQRYIFGTFQRNFNEDAWKHIIWQLYVGTQKDCWDQYKMKI